ncbi:centaurin beta [Microdochium trichocladiopsis]|uniref:ADP-ribosylation factor GTPase-activating protein n=1 Tax=Microdochium trichocladiopsis TaxID=1682393 RepID=A0A9P8Y8Z7_9PEZI|nr:centaurin beta [Microdochium trichocladiopsis]KAH7035194.1 centaurin beta [Microdochium trichocladiopsis]
MSVLSTLPYSLWPCRLQALVVSISSLVITSPRKRTSITVFPNAFPPTRVSASRPVGDASPVEFVQDPDPAATPSFLLKLSSDDELVFTFTFAVRQDAAGGDTLINGLTYVYASNHREVDNLVTREFHADPNLHKNSNVELVGDYSTGGSPSVTFDWSWKWKPPKATEDRGNGWRNSCSFVEYDQRGHRLVTLASFSFWVTGNGGYISQPNSPSPVFQLAVPPKIRVASAQSVESRISEIEEPASPLMPPSEASPSLPIGLQSQRESVKVDISCPRPAEDMNLSDDGPVFRATMKALEQKTGNMRTHMKKVLKKAEQAQTAQNEANDAFVSFIDALREASATNANAVRPALEHYFDKIAREILAYERQNTINMQKIIIDPISKLYVYDIKQAEAKKRDFEEESKEYYAYVSRYLGQRTDPVKTKKIADSDSKYQNKRRNFELKRFDYSSFMQDLHGGRKEQEVLSHLTKYANTQAQCFLRAAKKVDELLPQLEALSSEVTEADKEFQYQRREREEKRRVLEKSNGTQNDGESTMQGSNPIPVPSPNGHQTNSEPELGRADSTGSQLRGVSSSNSGSMAAAGIELSRSPGSVGQSTSPAATSKFRGIRDLEERDMSQLTLVDKTSSHRKEGLLWALNRPGAHVDPLSLNKQGWHKFWVVLDGGRLSEYSNWKQKLDLHMEPIDLRMASVREARNAERRFCFEVITPQFKRVYQATTDDDMANWILSINNALQSAVERGLKEKPSTPSSGSSSSLKRDIGSILTGKSISLNHGQHGGHSSAPAYASRRTTVGAKPAGMRPPSNSYDENPDKLLQMLRDNDQGNCWCADCGSSSKVEWVSINLAIILCIECSGIHRSLGTHISKVRSLTLDITSFTADIIELLLLVGNRVSNMIWEAKLDADIKPGPQASREQRLKFITAKYVDRAFVEPISTTLSRYPSPDETLLAAIKRNEIQQVIYALALKANPNVLDKVRGTHPVYLALAAADPASPSPSTANSTPATPEKTVPFPIAEMLLQNGAELPATLPAFPLSRSAQAFVEQKRGRVAAVDAMGSSVTTTLSPSASERQPSRDKDRLQKRISAGGRLARSPIAER